MSRDLITFRCPQCQAALSLPASMAGAAGPCLYCETEIIGPNPEIGQPAQLATPAPPEPPAAPFTDEPAATEPPSSWPSGPEEIDEPAPASRSPQPVQSPAPQSQGFNQVHAQSTAHASVNSPRQADAPAPGFTNITPSPAQTATAAPPATPPAEEVASSQPEAPAQRPSAPPSAPPESAPWDPFAQITAPPKPSPPAEPASGPSTQAAQAPEPAFGAPPFSLGDFAPPVPGPPTPSAPPHEPASAFTANRFSSETGTGAYSQASLPPLTRQANPLSPEQLQENRHRQDQAPANEPFGQPQAQPSDPFGQPQAQTGGGYPAGRDIPPHPAAPWQGKWQGSDSSPLAPISKLPGIGPVRELFERFRTSPLAPLAIAGTLVVLLIIFGIYLFRDYQEIVPNATPGGAAANPPTSPAPATAPAVDPATAATPPSGTAVDPGAATPDTPATTPDTPATTPGSTTPEAAPTPQAGSITATDPETGPETGPGAATTTPPPTTPDVDAPSSLLDGPIATLQAFVNASTWQERINYALYPEVVKPLMEIYYRNYPDEVVVPESIRFQHSETDPDTEKHFYVFHVTTEDAPDGFPVLIEETSDGLKVDWETFVEFKDNLFQRYSNNPSPGKLGAFHLIMRNAHYFGEEFPELKDLTPYRLDPPIPNQETYAFALTDSVVNKELQKQVTWGMNFTPFLELRWAKSQNGTDYLQVVSVLHTNWRNRTP